MDELAEKKGYNLEDFEDWYFSLPLSVRSNAKMSKIKERYYHGVNRRVDEKEEICRLSIYIKGAANMGKSYTTKKVLKDKRTLVVDGGKTGKYDNLKVTHEAIFVDDETSAGLLKMADNYFCNTYKRGSNNPCWTGSYFIVASNLPFAEWVTECGVRVQKNATEMSEQYLAIRSKFFICHIEENKKTGIKRLVCDVVSERGDYAIQKKRKEMFLEFKNKFNEILKGYIPRKEKVDYKECFE